MSAAPARHVALYDGDCEFCMRWRDRMIARDPTGAIEWVSVHDPSVASRFPGLDREDAMRQMWVYAPDGTVHKGAEGWRVLFRHLDGLSWVAVLYKIPGFPFVIDRVYRAIAARRYRLSCRDASCRSPDAGAGRGGRAGGGAKGLAIALLAPALCGALAASGCAESRPDPIVDRLQAIADPQSTQVVLDLFEAYGPYDAWSVHRNVEYTYRLQYYGGHPEPQATARQIHRFDLGPGDRAFSQDLDGASPQVVRVAGRAIDVVRAGVPITDPAQLEFPRAFMRVARWTFLLPWNLIDGESSLQYLGERTPPAAGRVPSDACDVVRLTFPPKDLARKDDWHDVYVSRVNHLIDRIHSYRGEDRTYWVSIWSEHKTFDKVRVATRRTAHASDVTGVLGPLEAVIEYSDVRFDAPFGEEVWNGMPPEPAESPTPAIPAAAGRLGPLDPASPPSQETR